jgi:hypothetical protein
MPGEPFDAQDVGHNIRTLLRMVEGFVTSQLVAATAQLRLADHLADGPLTVEELAKLLEAEPEATGRYLRACTSIGLTAAEPDGRFSVTPLAALLRSGTGSLRNYAISRTAAAQTRPWERVAEAVTTGQPTTRGVLGVDLWEYYRTHHDERDVFAATMSDLSAAAAQALVPAYDFSRYRRIMDIGGSYATLLERVLSASPESTGLLFDLPEVIERARQIVADLGIAGRLELVAGSFLEEVPRGGDLYILKQVLCDWDDQHVARILGNVHGAAPAGSTLLIIDWLRDGDAAASPLHINDLGLLVAVGGKIRTEQEYRDLLERAGFRHQRTLSVPGQFQPWSLLEARRA